MNKKIKLFVVVLLLADIHGVYASCAEDWSDLSHSDFANLDLNYCFEDSFSPVGVINNSVSGSNNITINVNNLSCSKKRKYQPTLDIEDDFLVDLDDYKPTHNVSSIVELAAKVGVHNEQRNQRMSLLEDVVAFHDRKYKTQNKRIHDQELLVKKLTDRVGSYEKMLHDNINNEIILNKNMQILVQHSVQGGVNLKQAMRVIVNMVKHLEMLNDNHDKKIKELEQKIEDQAQLIKDQAAMIQEQSVKK